MAQATTQFTPLAWYQRLGALLLGGLVRLLVHSLRITSVDLDRYLRLRDQGQPVIVVVWHSQLMLLLHHAARFGFTTLVSPSRDGEFATRVARGIGISSVRGDDRSGPVGALRSLLGVLRRGGDIGLFPDGPLGPPRKVKPGALALARSSGCPVLPVGVGAGWCIRFNSWDRFLLPLPFSRVVLVVGEPMEVAADALPSDLAVTAAALERRLDELTDQAAARCGR